MKLKHFLLAVAALAYVAEYVAARSQSFRKLFHQHMSYATVGVQLDMVPFQDDMFSLSKALSDVKFQRMNSFGRGTCSRLIKTMHGIERRLSDVKTSHILIPPGINFPDPFSASACHDPMTS